MSCDKSGATPLESGSNIRENLLITKKQQLETTRVIETQLKYLRGMLILLENRQAAEAIKCVVDYGKDPDDGKFKFLVAFDEALCQKELWIEEEVLDELDQLREQGLFKMNNIAHKTSRSLSAGNLIAFHYINEKVKKKNLVIKEKSWKELMKKKIKEKFDGFSRDAAATKLKEFGLCHHCKNIFPSEAMIKCNYRSSTMGLPTLNPTFLEPFSHDQTNPRSPKRAALTNKRSVYSFYTRKNGELFCTRKFCRICLKQNYDQNIGDVVNKPDWVCPFCQGLCYCSRCLRNDHINKLVKVYVLLGGDVAEVRSESYLEKFVYSNIPEYQEPPIKTPSELAKRALKPTRGKKKGDSVIKTKVKNYKSKSKEYIRLKKLRVELEKARLISSQVLRREKTKIKLEIMHQEMFRTEAEKMLGAKMALELFGNDEEDFLDISSANRGKKSKGSKEDVTYNSSNQLERLERKFGILKHVHTPTKIRSKSIIEESDESEAESPIKKFNKQKSYQKNSGKSSKIKKLSKIAPTGSAKKNKSSLIAKQLLLNEEGQEVAVKRKRGRPRLSEIKRPGRPSKILKKQATSGSKIYKKNSSSKDNMAVEEETPKRKRGRPRKYKPGQDEGYLMEEEDEIEDEDSEDEEEEYEDYEEDESEEEEGDDEEEEGDDEEEEEEEEEEYREDGEDEESEEEDEDAMDEEADSLVSEALSLKPKKPSFQKSATYPTTTPKRRGRPPKLVKKVKKEVDFKDFHAKPWQSTPKKNKIGPSQDNPNEPGDTVSPKAPRLKKELQKIMLGNQDVLPILLQSSADTRTTRRSFSLASKLSRTGSNKQK